MRRGVIIHIGLHPGALSDVLMIAVLMCGRRNYLTDETGGCRARRCILVDVFPLLHCSCVILVDVIESRRSLRRRLTIACLLMAKRHVALEVVAPAAGVVV